VRYFGTGSGSASPQIRPETTTGIVAAAGQTWTASYYLRIVGGSTTGLSAFSQIWQERDAAGVALNTVTVTISAPTTAALKTQRSILTRTLTDAGTARLTNRIQWTFTNGVAVDITLRIGLPQLEQGAFATSVIPTTTTALTRNADVASMTGTNFSSWFNAATGTIYSEWNSFANSTNRYLVDIEQAASSNDRIDININSSNVVNPRTVVSGSAVGTLTGGTYTVNTNAKVAFAYASADYASSFNGATAVTATTAGSLPSSLARMFIGSVAGSNFANGYIRRIAYYRVRLPNSTLQALTA
jgi:hypothetical protein